MAGVKGNNFAGKNKQWLAAIERALDKRACKSQGKTRIEALEDMAEKFLQSCDDGNLMAIKELADRLDGKAAQAVEVTGGAGGPVEHVVHHSMDKDAVELLAKIRGT